MNISILDSLDLLQFHLQQYKQIQMEDVVHSLVMKDVLLYFHLQMDMYGIEITNLIIILKILKMNMILNVIRIYYPFNKLFLILIQLK